MTSSNLVLIELCTLVIGKEWRVLDGIEKGLEVKDILGRPTWNIARRVIGARANMLESTMKVVWLGSGRVVGVVALQTLSITLVRSATVATALTPWRCGFWLRMVSSMLITGGKAGNLVERNMVPTIWIELRSSKVADKASFVRANIETIKRLLSA